MGMLDAFLEGWEFRSSRPEFEAGETIHLEVTGYDPETERAVARVGDTHLFIEESEQTLLGHSVRLKVETFDPENATGTARLLEVLDTD